MRRWLEPGELPSEKLMELLAPYPAREMEANPVGRAVNNPRTDSADCIESMTAPQHAPAPHKTRRRRDKPDEPTLF